MESVEKTTLQKVKTFNLEEEIVKGRIKKVEMIRNVGVTDDRRGVTVAEVEKKNGM